MSAVGPRVQAPRARDALHGDAGAQPPRHAQPQAQAQPPPRQAQPQQPQLLAQPPSRQAQPQSQAQPPPRQVPGPADRPPRSRLDDIEARLARLESGADGVPALKRGLVALARSHQAEAERLESVPAAVERQVAQMVAQTVKQYVEQHVEVHVDEGSSLPEDVEGIYKELDHVAELVGKRDAAVEASLARIESLERSVERLRRNLERAVRQLTDAPPIQSPAIAPDGAGAGTSSPAFAPEPPVSAPSLLGDGRAGYDAALERARRRRELTRPRD